ncbi:MAG: YtxH domain-containing protein [bacterium]
MSDNGDSGFNFFKGFLFGGIVGAVIAILYAPKSGKEVREDLRTRSLELRGDAEAKLQLAQKKAEAILEETKKKLEELRKETQTAVSGVSDKAAIAIQQGKTTIEKEKDKLKSAIDAGVNAYKEERSAKKKKA